VAFYVAGQLALPDDAAAPGTYRPRGTSSLERLGATDSGKVLRFQRSGWKIRIFRNVLRERFPRAEVHDLQPAVTELRAIRSASELDLLREAGRLAAEGIKAAMRATRSGAFEYPLEAAAQNIHLSAGACNPSYVCMIMGDKRPFTHYDPYRGRLAEGEVVLGDCAPDYRYSTSDIARIWPVNGEFSPAQRAFYDFPLAFQECVLVQVKPGATCQALMEQVHTIRRQIFQTSAFFARKTRLTPSSYSSPNASRTPWEWQSMISASTLDARSRSVWYLPVNRATSIKQDGNPPMD